MEIRNFENNDTDAVIELWEVCELVVPWNDPRKDIARKVDDGGELFLVAVDNRQVIGSAMGGYDGHRGWVNYLAVHPDFRFMGVAREIMHELEGRLIVLGCPKINLQIRSANKEVRAFYESLEYMKDDVVSYGKRLIPDD